MNTLHTHLLANAWTEGVIGSYVSSYIEVLTQLEAARATHILVPVCNTLLQRMRQANEGAYHASLHLLDEVKNARSKMFIMAAAVELVIGNHDPSKPVAAITPLKQVVAG